MRDLSPDEEAFLKEGVSQYLPAVRALGDFVEYCTDAIRETIRPYDERLRSLGLVCSSDKLDYWPRIGTAPESLITVAIKVPDRSCVYIEVYFNEVEPASSMWIGTWFWPRDAQSRSDLFKLCDSHGATYGLDVEKHSGGTVYLGTYADYREQFPHVESMLNTVVLNILELFEKIGFAERITDSLKK
jgi:hypothetical protein